MKRKLAITSLLLALIATLFISELRQRWSQPLNIPAAGYPLLVKSGDSLRSVSEALHKAGVLPHPQLLQLYGRWSGLDAQIKRGEYLLPQATTAALLLDQLQRGKVIQYQVTLPEGITLSMALSILSKQEGLLATLQGPRDPKILTLVKPHTSGEGLFFPDSYSYARGDSDWSILQRAHRTMVKTLATQWQEKADSLPYKNAYEALIMASIIERETGQAQERGEISGVFFRRLQKGMRLQTDPTVIYGLGEEFNGNLRRSHLRDEGNSYNTYRHRGLPPTPIALPGDAAIKAALHPERGKTLYFVARGDGSHQFSATLAEHNQAVRKYQLQRKKNYRSAPENKK